MNFFLNLKFFISNIICVLNNFIFYFFLNFYSSAELMLLLQKRMIIKSRADYPRNTVFPPNLIELQIASIGLKSIDFRWFYLNHLKLLNLANNSLGKYMKKLDWRKFSCIQRLKFLEDLNLSENDFQYLPVSIKFFYLKNFKILKANFTIN